MAVCGCRQARAVSPERPAALPRPVEGPKAVAAAVPERLRVTLHGASLRRSFAKVGVMDPYVVVIVADQEVHRTAPARWSHKQPRWGASFTVRADELPRQITFAVWDANRLHKDVPCGSVTVPCSADMGQLEGKEFALTKNSEHTGTLRLSLAVLDDQVARARTESGRTPMSPLGAELDHMASWLHETTGEVSNRLAGQQSALELQESFAARQEGRLVDASPTLLGGLSLSQSKPSLAGAHRSESAKALLHEVTTQDCPGRPPTPKATDSTQQDDQREETTLAVPVSLEGAENAEGDGTASFLVGHWNCVATEGLEEFLKRTGVGAFQRKLAMAARWPAWEFSVVEQKLRFINHSAMGDLVEDVPLGSETYQWRDGRGNLMSCTPRWQATADGGRLTIARTGPIGAYTEEREVVGDTLTFLLTTADGVAWGRTFRRQA